MQKEQSNAAAERKTFRELFCQLAACPVEEFEKRVLMICVHSDHPWLARMYYRFDKENFQPDFEMIRRLGRTTGYAEFKQEVEVWRSSHPSKGYLRKNLRFRVSGKNLLKLASRLFKHPGYFGFTPARTEQPSHKAAKK